MSFRESKAHSIQVIDLFDIPPQVEAKHIHENGKLLTDLEIKAVKTELKDSPDGRYSRALANSPYPIIKLNGEYFAVYLGEKHKKELGKGGQGKVKVVQNLSSDLSDPTLRKSWYALKIMKEREAKVADKEIEEKIKRNFDLFVAEHKKLVSLGKAKPGILTRKKPGATAKHQFIMDYEKGSDLIIVLTEQVNTIDKLPTFKKIDFLLQMIDEVKTLHAKRILHCDIKPENFMFDFSNGKVRLIDFGLAMDANKHGVAKSNYLVGSKDYQAPELGVENPAQYSEKTEVYALGQTFDRIVEYLDLDSDQELLDKIKIMIAEDPKLRPTLNELTIFFQKKSKEILPFAFSTQGVLNLAEYKKNPDYFNTALKHVDSVFIVDEEKSDTSQRNAIVKSLREKNIIVRDKAVISSDIPAALGYVSKLVEQDAKPGEVCHSFFMTSNPDLIEKDIGMSILHVDHSSNKVYKKQVSEHYRINEKDLEKIILLLMSELKRITDKYNLGNFPDRKAEGNSSISIALRRRNAIQLFMEQLRIKYAKKEVSYITLEKDLAKLQSQMISTGNFSKLFGRMFEGKEAIIHVKKAVTESKKTHTGFTKKRG